MLAPITRSTRDKRSTDDRIYDVLCDLLLDPDEFITACAAPVVANQIPTLDPPQDPAPVDLTFGTPVINPAAVFYPEYQRWAPAGKVVQVAVIGGSIPNGAPNYAYTVRFLLTTNLNPTVEATVIVNMVDTI